MPPPVVFFLVPGVALFFLLQILLCHAYHFQVTLTRHKTRVPDSSKGLGQDGADKGKSKKAMKPGRDKSETSGSEPGPDPKEDSRKSKSKRPSTVNFSEPESEESEQEETTSEVNDFSAPKEDRLKARRKSVFAESYDPSKDDDDAKVVNPKTPEEAQWLINNVGKVTLFQLLAKDQLMTVVDAMYKYPAKEGDYIMKQGDKGSTFYVVQSGVYNVYITDQSGTDQLIHTYDNKGSFGELALLYNQPRAATIIAQSDGTLWAVDGQTFRRIVHKITYQKRMMYENLINNVPMLKKLEPYERANLVDALVPMTFNHNEQIIQQGAEPDGMYFIISGRVRIVIKTKHNKEILVKELGSGEYFGELALVTKKPRSASGYAIGATHLAFLDRNAFERLLGPCMDVIRRHIDDYSGRLSEILQK